MNLVLLRFTSSSYDQVFLTKLIWVTAPLVVPFCQLSLTLRSNHSWPFLCFSSSDFPVYLNIYGLFSPDFFQRWILRALHPFGAFHRSTFGSMLGSSVKWRAGKYDVAVTNPYCRVWGSQNCGSSTLLECMQSSLRSVTSKAQSTRRPWIHP